MKPSAHTKPNTRRKKKGATHRATQRAENGRVFCENAWGTLRTGDIVQAKKYAKMALSFGADEGRAYSILAAIALAENDSSAVLACSDRGLAKTAYESYRLYLHAARCQANELWEEALENAKNAFNLDTTNDLALLAIADAQRNLNNRLPAFVIYQNLRNK